MNRQTLIKSEIRQNVEKYFYTVQAIGEHGMFVWHEHEGTLEEVKAIADERSGCVACSCDGWREGPPPPFPIEIGTGDRS
jgi:hypothetical protein